MESQEMCPCVVDIWIENKVDGVRQKTGGKDVSHLLEMS